MRPRLQPLGRRRLIVLLAAVGLAIVGAGLVLQATQSHVLIPLPTPGWQAGVTECRRDAFAHVPLPDSLDVVSACAKVSGTVRRVKVDPVKLEVDILVEPDRDSASYIDPSIQRFMIVKVLPTDQPSVKIPQVDEYASFFGAWVIDRRASATGTRELYPAWLIQTSAQAPAAPARNILALKLSAPASVEVGSPLRLSVSVRSSSASDARPLSESRVYLELRPSRGSVARWAARLTDTFGIATFNLASLEVPGTYTIWIHASKGRDYGTVQAEVQIKRR
jgi:hypothetical protein